MILIANQTVKRAQKQLKCAHEKQASYMQQKSPIRDNTETDRYHNMHTHKNSDKNTIRWILQL